MGARNFLSEVAILVPNVRIYADVEIYNRKFSLFSSQISFTFLSENDEVLTQLFSYQSNSISRLSNHWLPVSMPHDGLLLHANSYISASVIVSLN
jgi:hypothetical protein